MRMQVLALAAIAAVGPAPALAANVVQNWVLITTTGTDGVLRAGSPWGPGSAPSSPFLPVDGLFQPENTQWNNGSFWWDEDPSVNQAPVSYVVQLDQAYTVNRFVVQADDNDSYLLEYWDGASWVSAFDIPAVFTFGLVRRDSGIVGAITTDRFRFTATGGDAYYSVSEIQAYAVPEPATWGMLIAGFGLAGWALRRRKAAPA